MLVWRSTARRGLLLSIAIACTVILTERAGESQAQADTSPVLYFVPISISTDHIKELQRYYRDVLHLQSEVLRTFVPSGAAWNPRLRHWRAEALVGELIEREEARLRRGKVVVIGITGDDLQSVEEGREFGWRTAARAAVVSYARMDPKFYRQPEDATALQTRLRRMVTRFIGLLYFELPASHDPHSPLYDGIDGPADLDAMQDDLAKAGFLSVRPLLDYQQPVSLTTGLYIHRHFDFALEDTPRVVFERTYRTHDPVSRPFGIGTNHTYGTFLVGDAPTFSFVQLILEDGFRVDYRRISPGTGIANAEFVHDENSPLFFNSRLSWDRTGWQLKLENGASYRHPACSPTTKKPCTVSGYRDENGRQIRMSFDAHNNLVKIESEHHHTIDLQYDDQDRVVLAWDDTGHSFSYAYDDRGRLIQATYGDGRSETYEYDAQNRMLGFRNEQVIETMAYDSHGRCTRTNRQWVYYIDAAGHSFRRRAVYAFAYTVAADGHVENVLVTGPDA